jgi:hypothetical protein
MEERDRRYAELQAERDKAEVIRAANQAYRDEKANELREQISAERGLYVSQTELKSAIAEITATLRPIVDFVSAQQGAKTGAMDQRLFVSWAVALIATIIGIYFAFN